MNKKTLFVAVTRLLPGWASSVALGAFFLVVWVAPERFGWEAMYGIETGVYVELVAVFGTLLLITNRDLSLRWIWMIPTAALVGLGLYLSAGVLVAVVVPIHLIWRVAGIRGDYKSESSALNGLTLGVGLMAACWFAVGLFPFPELGWTREATPYDLWWEAPFWTGSRRVPFGLPAWAFLYFFASAAGDAARHSRRMLDKIALKTTL